MQMRLFRVTSEHAFLVLLIVASLLVALGLLWRFPALWSSPVDSQSSYFWSAATPFAITASAFNSTFAAFTLSNKASEALMLTSITLEGGGSTAVLYVPNESFLAGEEKKIVAGFSKSNVCSILKPGTMFEYRVTLNYTQGGITQIAESGPVPLISRCS